MIKLIGHYYKITSTFVDADCPDKNHPHIQVIDECDDAKCAEIVDNYLRIGVDYVRDNDGKIIFNNGFYLHGEDPLGITDVHIEYIGEWAEVENTLTT